MGTIPPDSVGGPSGLPEPKEPSGPLGDFGLDRLNTDQKKKLDSFMGQLNVMGQIEHFNPTVFQNLSHFLTGIEHQSPPLKKAILDKIKEANQLVHTTTASNWVENSTKVQNLLQTLVR